jgi:hypothetical protein
MNKKRSSNRNFSNRQNWEKNHRQATQAEYNRVYRYFCRVCCSLPDYINRNLEKMPNNRGYIWRGCWFLGRKQEEKGRPQVLFEKVRSGLIRIHEYTKDEYRLYEKQGKERKILIQMEQRRKPIETSF